MDLGQWPHSSEFQIQQIRGMRLLTRIPPLCQRFWWDQGPANGSRFLDRGGEPWILFRV